MSRVRRRSATASVTHVNVRVVSGAGAPFELQRRIRASGAASEPSGSLRGSAARRTPTCALEALLVPRLSYRAGYALRASAQPPHTRCERFWCSIRATTPHTGCWRRVRAARQPARLGRAPTPHMCAWSASGAPFELRGRLRASGVRDIAGLRASPAWRPFGRLRVPGWPNGPAHAIRRRTAALDLFFQNFRARIAARPKTRLHPQNPPKTQNRAIFFSKINPKTRPESATNRIKSPSSAHFRQ